MVATNPSIEKRSSSSISSNRYISIGQILICWPTGIPLTIMIVTTQQSSKAATNRTATQDILDGEVSGGPFDQSAYNSECDSHQDGKKSVPRSNGKETTADLIHEIGRRSEIFTDHQSGTQAPVQLELQPTGTTSQPLG